MKENLKQIADYVVYDNSREGDINESLYTDEAGEYFLLSDRDGVNNRLFSLSRKDVVNWARNCGEELGLFITAQDWLISLYTAGEVDSEFYNDDVESLLVKVPA